MTRKEIW